MNILFAFSAMLGTMLWCVGMFMLIPEGMWLYLAMVTAGPALATYAITQLPKEE